MHLGRIRIAELSNLEIDDEHNATVGGRTRDQCGTKYRPSLRHFAENGLFLWFLLAGTW
jgi:hypothetical protein